MLWKFKIKTLFEARELSRLVSGEEMKPKVEHVAKLLTYEKKEKKTLTSLSKVFLTTTHEC
jgi:hypothetical protein